MVYLPTFGWFFGQMLVNVPYMEHMGIYIYSKICIDRFDLGIAYILTYHLTIHLTYILIEIWTNNNSIYIYVLLMGHIWGPACDVGMRKWLPWRGPVQDPKRFTWMGKNDLATGLRKMDMTLFHWVGLRIFWAPSFSPSSSEWFLYVSVPLKQV